MLKVLSDFLSSAKLPEKTEIEKAEKLLGVKLPPNLLKLSGSDFEGEVYCQIPNFGPENLDFQSQDLDGIADSEDYIKEWGMKSGLVLFCGDGHVWFALNYRNTKSWEDAPVVFVNNYKEPSQELEMGKNFDAFLEKLIPPPEELGLDIPIDEVGKVKEDEKVGEKRKRSDVADEIEKDSKKQKV